MCRVVYLQCGEKFKTLWPASFRHVYEHLATDIAIAGGPLLRSFFVDLLIMFLEMVSNTIIDALRSVLLKNKFVQVERVFLIVCLYRKNFNVTDLRFLNYANSN